METSIYWVGLNDQANEGDWRWVNGQLATADATTVWSPGDPDDNGGTADCASFFFSFDHEYGFRSVDGACFHAHKAICEKLI